MTWLDGLIENAERPLVERLRYLDRLEPRDDLTPEIVVDALHGDAADAPDLACGLARLVRPDRWIPLARRLTEEQIGYVSTLFVAELDTRVVPRAIAALDTGDRAFALHVLAELWKFERARDAFAPGWPAIERLAGSFTTAAVLLARARRFGPSVHEGLTRALAAGLGKDAYAYDEQVQVEDLLWHIAHAGTELRSLAPSLVPFLRHEAGAWRSSALLTAIGIGATSLRSMIEPLARSAPSPDEDGSIEHLARVIEGALALYASWQFGGAEEDLARALAASEPSIVSMNRISSALEVSPVDERLLSALQSIAVNPSWRATACRALAKIGAAAAPFVRGLPELGPDDEAYVFDCEARWRCGVRSPDETRRALERKLEWPAWDPYIELAATDDLALARVREQLPQAIGALAGSIASTRLLPELLRGGYETQIFLARRMMSTEAFWAALS